LENLVFANAYLNLIINLKEEGVATVNDEPITLDEYKQEYNNITQQLRNRFGDQLNDDLLKMFKVRQQAMDSLVDRKVILEEARKLNIEVSDKELGASIAKISVFQKNGIFDGQLYRTVLTRNRMNPEMFELLQRNSLLQEKLSSIILSSAKVSDELVKQWFDWENSSVSINYALFDPNLYKDVNPTEDEIKAYYEKNKANYKTEPELRVDYLHFDPVHFKNAVEITSVQISEYFDENSEKFSKPATVKARHILLKNPPVGAGKKADKDAVEKVRLRALEIVKEAKDGKDFAELAL